MKTYKGQRTRDKGRIGVSLTEVLIAIFILGIGLMSLLALFPVGAFYMAQSLQDERAAEAAITATSVAKIKNVRDDSSVFPLYTNPGGGLPVLMTGNSGPSYPVYVDPLGAMLGSNRIGVAGGSPGFARSSHSTINNSTQIARWLSLLDDMYFNEDGLPKNGQVVRDTRFSWAYLCRQGRVFNGSPPTPSGVDLTVVVYERRPWLLGPTGTPEGETAYQANFTAGSNLATITWPGPTPPKINKGTWILDATVTPTINGYFYRVSKYTRTGPNTMELVLNANARSSLSPGTPWAGVAVVLEHVVEVFEKGPN